MPDQGETLDIEVPEEPILTWKQFFVHMGTIVLGLLIAISLEQTVEWLHHRHQRHQVEEDMRDEAEHNIHVIDEDYKLLNKELTELRAVRKVVRETPEVNGFVTFEAPIETGAPQADNMTSPSRGTWAVAKAAGLIGLIPRERARIYTRIDFEANQELKAEDIANEVYNRMVAQIEGAREVGAASGKLRIAGADRDDFIRMLSQYISAEEWTIVRLGYWRGACEALVHEVKTEEEMMPYVHEAAKAAQESYGKD